MSRFIPLFAMLLVCSCGPARLTWKVQVPDLQENPVTKSRYAIKSFVVSYPDEKLQVDVLQNSASECSCDLRSEPSRKWVDALYEAYPNVFCVTGIPISVTAEWTRREADDRGGVRKFIWSVGWITLVPVIPVEWIENAKWTLTVSVGEVVEAPVCVWEYDERRRSVLPIGYLCFFADGNEEPFQTTERFFPHLDDDLRMQMKALGAGIAAELIAMEREGRVAGEMGADAGRIKSRTFSQSDVRMRILEEERLKNLDSLLKSGVITEDEYRKEIEGVVK